MKINAILLIGITCVLACTPEINQDDIHPTNPECPVDYVCNTCPILPDNKDRWPDGKCEAHYYIGENNPADDESINKAFKEWGDALGIQFIESQNENDGNVFIKILFKEYNNNEIQEYRNQCGCLGEPLGATPPNSNTIVFNSKANWDGNISNSNCEPISLRLGVLHELGHVLGLGHSSIPNDIMFGSYSSQSGLTENDKNRAKNLLGFSCSDKFKRTENNHPWNTNCFTCICQESFGDNYQIADWEEVKSFIAIEGYDKFYEMTIMNEYRSNGWITVNGQHLWASDRHYFIERHNGNIPSGWLVHQHIGNHTIDLGSWFNSRPILCSRKD